ncbi:MAG: hypothetical protein ACRD8U_15490 [Pyrinomonadaceae bacterium]
MELDITVKNNEGEILATGTLDVDTSGPNDTATFTPTDGSEVNCNGVTWPNSGNGAVGFNFQVSGSANGDFPLGPNSSSVVYNFRGTLNDNSSANGNVNWPISSPEGGEDVTWQGGSTTGEPYAAGKAAK